jgi:hypothetical protein
MAENVFKMPRMKKTEYDRLVRENCVCRIAFKGDEHPHVAPFIYVFDGRCLYFLSTRYGKKVRYFRDNPLVTVEIDEYSPDLSLFRFVALPGKLVEVNDAAECRAVRERFIDLVGGLSTNVLSALGHSPDQPVDVLREADNNTVWKLVSVDVARILGLKSHTR